jgi:biotin carboxyl carrier protein
MKMEHEIAAPRDGVVSALGVAVGQAVTNGQLICIVAEPE